MKEIVSVEWLNENLDNKNLIILNASLKSMANGLILDLSKKTIPKSRYFDIKNNFSDKNSVFPNTLPTAKNFEIECKNLGINKTSKIVVFDNVGVYSSPRVWWLFKIMGHHNISVLNGGLPEWKRKKFLICKPKSNTYKLGNFKATFQNKFLVNYQDILLNTTNKTFLIIDARTTGRFHGIEKEPRKHLKSGHIPYSVNLPYSKVLKNGKFKTNQKLKKIFDAKCFNAKDLVFTCGSGLTACIIMLACEMSYKKSKRIYDGSWSEWAELQSLKENMV